MGNYVTYAALQTRIGATRLADFLSDVGDATAQEAYAEASLIAAAESTVNGYVSKQRAVPVTASSQYYAMLVNWVNNLLDHELYKLGFADDIPLKVRTAFEDTMRTLADVARGLLSITDDDGSGPDSTGGSFDFKGATAIFSSSAMEDAW